MISWPCVNASLNMLCALLLLAGYVFIRLGRPNAHRAAMLGALTASAAFLVSYVLYHVQVGSVRYTGQGLMRSVYFTLLISHSILAAAVVPMALSTLYLARSGRFDTHRRLARWTLPVWLYVSVTGVVIYAMLY